MTREETLARRARYQRSYCAAHPERVRARAKTYREAHKPKIAADLAEYYRTHLKEARAYNLKTKYGLTVAGFDTMLAGQGGACAICGTSDFSSGRAGRPAVDHDHDTGAIRGLLCLRCNVGLGAFKERADLIRAAAGYLEKP